MTNVPQGYKQDAKGNLTPVANIKPEDLLMDDLVGMLIPKAIRANEILAELKELGLGEAAEFRALLLEKYGVRKGGKKGNMTLRSFDGNAEIQIQVSETLRFGPELLAAKELIDDCIERWSEGSNVNIKVLIDDAFQINKDRQIDTHRVLGLRKHDMGDDPVWARAMDAIADAVLVTGSKTYIRFFERGKKTGNMEPIKLHLAAL